MKKLILLIISCPLIYSQNINLNNNFVYDDLRFKHINNELETNFSMNISQLTMMLLKTLMLISFHLDLKKYFQIKKNPFKSNF